MGGAEHDKSGAVSEPDTNRPQLYKLIFDQNLDEVHLLIDFISGRADRSLSSLSIPSLDGSSTVMTSRHIIQAIANMRFPPKGNDAVNADNAAILLLAKDKLSGLAAPARGLTIAYTAMFIDAEVKTWVSRLWGQFWDWRRRRGGGSRSLVAAQPPGQPPSEHDMRVDLAVRAFPILQSHARRFRRWRDALAMFSVFWLLLTALAYWDACLGRETLERLDQNWKNYTTELTDDPALLHCGSSQTNNAPTGDAKAIDDATRVELACRRHVYHQWMGEAAVAEVQNVFHCSGMGWYKLAVHVWCWHWLLSGTTASTELPDMSAAASPVASVQGGSQPPIPAQLKDNATYWQWATSILSVFTAYVLPMMFALLGTLIGSFRAILNRVRDNELAPRDFVRMVLGIPTGLVAGVAVGLFLSPTSVPIQGEGGLAGQLTLTASGLGFLAGYASHYFFTYLDTVVGTVFPNPTTTNSNAPRRVDLHQG